MDYRKKVNEAINYIEKSLDEKITLDELAKKARLSKFHYHRLFHKIAGESLHQYVSRLRMENAARELVETDQPIIDIALKYQYGSQEAFSRAFKKIYNVTPGKYRKTSVNKGAEKRLHMRAHGKHNIAA